MFHTKIIVWINFVSEYGYIISKKNTKQILNLRISCLRDFLLITYSSFSNIYFNKSKLMRVVTVIRFKVKNSVTEEINVIKIPM